MQSVILRRRRLGRTSCREIGRFMSDLGVSVSVARNDRESDWPINSPEFVFRWGCTSDIPNRAGMTIFNKASSIHEVNDKLRFRRILNEAELCPLTWFMDADWSRINFFPVVVRPSKHAQGRHLYVCHSVNEVRHAILQCRRVGSGYYISELIDKVAEYRVFVSQGRAVWVAEKTPGNPQDVAWNVARGGRFDNVRWDNWPLKAVKYSIQAFNLSSLDYGGVDVMVDSEGGCYILEINSAPSQTSPYRQECVAKTFKWMIDNGADRIPLTESRGGYRKFIHPAICERAIL